MFRNLFPLTSNCSANNVPKIIGMIHATALPATPGYKTSGWNGHDTGMQKILDQAKKETEIFAEFEGMTFNLTGIMICHFIIFFLK